MIYLHIFIMKCYLFDVLVTEVYQFKQIGFALEVIYGSGKAIWETTISIKLVQYYFLCEFNLQQCVGLQAVGQVIDVLWSVACNRQLLRRPELRRPFDWLR
jgi:hypothetical protein